MSPTDNITKRPAKLRSLKIETVGDYSQRKTKPRIRLSGQWLERAGFIAGHRVEIHLHQPGEMTLQFREESAPNQTG
jgi:hypothetical protein